MPFGTLFAKSVTQNPSSSNIKNSCWIALQRTSYLSHLLKKQVSMTKRSSSFSKNSMTWFHKLFTIVYTMLIPRAENHWTMNSCDSWSTPLVSFSLVIRSILRLLHIGVPAWFKKLQISQRKAKMLHWLIMKLVRVQIVDDNSCLWDIVHWWRGIWSLITMRPSTMLESGKCY